MHRSRQRRAVENESLIEKKKKEMRDIQHLLPIVGLLNHHPPVFLHPPQPPNGQDSLVLIVLSSHLLFLVLPPMLLCLCSTSKKI